MYVRTFLPLFAWIEREVIHISVVLCPNIIKAAVVSESSPLHVDTHPPIVALDQLHVLHLLHVTGVAARTCDQADALDRLSSETCIRRTEERGN